VLLLVEVLQHSVTVRKQRLCHCWGHD